MGKTISLSLNITNKMWMSTFTTLIQCSTRNTTNRRNSRTTRNQTRRNVIKIVKKKVKLSLFTDYMIICIKNPKDSTKKLLQVINEFNKVEGYKMYIQKSVTFLYTYGELSERETKKTI